MLALALALTLAAADVCPPAAQFSSAIKGHFADETIASVPLRENRRVTIYTPPDFDPAKRYPVVYLADGFAVFDDARMIEPLILDHRLPPLLLVGLWAASPDEGHMRSEEYLDGYVQGSYRFRQHENFFITEVMPLVERKYGASQSRDQRLVAGFSDGAGWALSMGLRHPDLFGYIGAFSIGWLPSGEGVARPGRPKLFLSAGTDETNFYKTTSTIASHARESPEETIFKTCSSGHSFAIWHARLLEAVQWAFSPQYPGGGGGGG